MAKVQGNYASLVKGVSQQSPADRLEGQHGEVLNMLSDPVRGLVRRNGMLLEDQVLTVVSDPDTADATMDSASYRTYSYHASGRDLDLIYRGRAKVGASTNHLAGLVVFDKTPGVNQFVPVVSGAGDTTLASFLDGGVSAAVNVGDYVLLAGAAVTPTYSSADKVDGQSYSNSAAVWVRGGTYSRTYTVTAKRASDNASFTVSYTTKAAAYPGGLDTSSLVFTDPDYQKQVNDMTYAYNAAVNQWIGDASADIVPANIAQKLLDALTTAGFTGWTRNGSHIGSTDCAYVYVTDGGDGSLLVAVRSETAAADEVTDMHYPGKVVKVQPRTASDTAFYLRADRKDGVSSGSGLMPVVWREAAGVLQTPTLVFAVGLYHEGTFYLSSTPAALAALVLAETGDTIDVPGYVPSASGDLSSAEPPHFFGRKITALAMFQDRLVVVADSVVNMSRVGDYLNFYRTSALTVADDDPIEVFALGSEADTIRQAGVFDHNLMLAGDRFHYMMNGRVVHTPATSSISVQFSVANTAGARPQATGPYLFWLKADTLLGSSRLMQVKQGLFQDNPQMDDMSRQLRDYVNGAPAEMVVLSSPETVFIRTEPAAKPAGSFPPARPWGLYVYQFMDGPSGDRVQSAWGAWEWSTALGTPIGITAVPSNDAVLLYTLAWGVNEDGDPVRAILAQTANARPDESGLPYLDGMRSATDAEADGLFTAGAEAETLATVYTAKGAAQASVPVAASSADASRFQAPTSPHYTLGGEESSERWSGTQGHRSDYAVAYAADPLDNLWTGVAFPAYVDLTVPFVRDSKGKAKTWGRLVLTRLRATLIRTAGFEARFIDHTGEKLTAHFEDEFERMRYGFNIWIGRDAREVQMRLAARKWLPLTINALEWAGQWFEPTQQR